MALGKNITEMITVKNITFQHKTTKSPKYYVFMTLLAINVMETIVRLIYYRLINQHKTIIN